jgi:O-antigen ligase
MINPFYIKDTVVNKISYYHLLAFGVALPFDRFYSQLIFISLLIHTLINYRKDTLKNIRWREILIVQSVFLLTIIGTSWTNYTNGAFSEWEKQLSILVFPILLHLNPINPEKSRKILVSFGYCCTLVILYLYFDAFRIISYYHFPVKKLFTIFFLNHNFSKPIDLHATYLSLYVALSIIAFIHYLLKPCNSRLQKVVFVSCILIMTAGLLQLASRSVLIAFMIILNLVLPFFCGSQRRGFQFLMISFTATAMIVFCIAKTDMLNLRLLQGFKNDLSTSSIKYTVAEPRAERWKIALDLVKESPVIGYGSGSEVPMLKEKYFEHKLYDSYLNELNAHNQYLSMMLKSGLAGLAVFIFVLTWGFRSALRRKDLLLLSFLVLVTVVSLSENILDVNKGIFFYAFFFYFFTSFAPEKREKVLPVKAAGNPGQVSNVLIYQESVNT